MSKHILLLSAYDAQSHQRWRQGLVRHLPEHDWTALTLPARYFNWRIRGNALTWAFEQKDILAQDYDLLITTSMTDLATLRGLFPSLCHIRTLIYFHENQFAYPNRNNQSHNGQTKRFLEAKITSLYSALAADQVVFNSEWNRDSFLTGVTQLLNTMPDAVPSGVVETLTDKSSILPVPLEDDCFNNQKTRARNSDFTILWNHRWEYDKAPERFFAALLQLKKHGFDFKLHVVGQQFRSSPNIFNDVKSQLENEILTWGYIEDESAYRKIIKESDVVVSTALHDFQGLAILEAVAAGCIPVVPDRLAYQQFIPATFLYSSFPYDFEREVNALTIRLSELIELFKDNKYLSTPNMEYLRWDILKSAYRSMINR